MGTQVMRVLLIAMLFSCASCTFAWNAAHPHTHESRAAVRQEAARLRELGPSHYKMADRLEPTWERRVGAPMFCMFGDMGFLIGGAGALSAAQSLERQGRISMGAVEPINLAGLAVSAIVFVSLGVTLKIYDHL
jgi:hypothetical protein